MTVYETTRKKLCRLGVGSHPYDEVILKDQRLFLLFVDLERAWCLLDFDQVYRGVENIAEYLNGIGRRGLVEVAYRYLGFSGGVRCRWSAGIEGGTTIQFSEDLSQEEVVIRLWAHMQRERVSDWCTRARSDWLP